MLPEKGRRLFGWALLPYLLLMFTMGLFQDGVDNWGHFGGLVAGLVFGFVLDPPPLQRRAGWNRFWQSGIVGGTLVLLTTFALVGPRLHPLRTARSRETPTAGFR